MGMAAGQERSRHVALGWICGIPLLLLLLSDHLPSIPFQSNTWVILLNYILWTYRFIARDFLPGQERKSSRRPDVFHL